MCYLPLYRFVCEDCGNEESLLLKIDSQVPPCEKCGGSLSKQITNISSFGCSSGSESCGSCSGGSCSTCGN
ncbi:MULTISPECIES: zinc ribbon domain-containing protein [unclassified Mesotoga]|uniref:zinc ribbon domain-containing protein n=1 Tax=unclassified Mesotoga TaxID=1184398 RepID=UPI003457F2AB